MHFPDRVLRAPLRPIAIGIRIEVCFKDRFQHQLCGGLHHPVPYGRNPQWPLTPARLRDFHPPHGLWCIRLCPKVIPDAVQPFPQPCRFDPREALPIHSRRALIGLCQCICMVQNVFPVDLVVEQVETVVRLFLRFLVQLPLKHPDLNRCLQAHRQSPVLSFFKSTSEARVLPSAGITRHHRYRDPLRLPGLAVILTMTLEAQPPPSPDLPQLPRPLSLHAVLNTPADRTGACRFLPCPRGLPRLTGGSASTTSLSGPAQASLALRPARLLARPKADFCPEASTRPVARLGRPVATTSYRQLHGGFLLPRAICAVGAHC